PVRLVGRAGLAWLEAHDFAETRLVRHAFSTRRGGVSAGPWASLNLGYGTGDAPQHVAENRRRLLAAVGLAGRPLVTVRQVHGDGLVVVEGVADAEQAANLAADGVLTASPEVAVAVLTADCLPVLLLDRRRKAVAAIHSGWRGTVLRIAGRAVRRMGEEFGTAPEDVLAAIGPGIGPCCYEVDRPVLERLAEAFPRQAEGFLSALDGDRAHLDLRAAVLADLKESGVPDENVTVVDACTSCQPERFFSYRRQGGSTGRMAAVIGLQEGTGCREGKDRPGEGGHAGER
ncbi:MAG TPA: peptidoglycan editing factor PgeF, partial [Firmicutes bacterium]|nr:peptidoglycan editing factor PgeF [Bacillota bacterium]